MYENYYFLPTKINVRKPITSIGPLRKTFGNGLEEISVQPVLS